ncbi:MATE family efflux transporter, partial [Acinetobacter schindleri]
KGYFGFPALGIIAPAIASIISYIAILIFLAIYLNKKKHPLRPNRQLLQHIRHNSALSKIILRLGVPTGIQMMITSMAG